MFSKTGTTVSNKYYVQLQKSIYCSEKSEGATIGILLKKTCNFIRKRLQYCKVYKNTRSSHQRCSIIKRCSYIFRKIHRKTPVPGFLCLRLATLLRKRLETLAPVFSCEFCEIYKNIFFTEHLWATASTNSFHHQKILPLRSRQ